MNLFSKTLLLLLLFSFFTIDASAEIKFLGKDTLDLRGSFRYLEGSGFFDLEGNETLQIDLPDQEGEDDPLKYRYNLDKFTLDLSADFYLTDDLILSAEIPFSVISYNEKFDTLIKGVQYNYNTSQYDTVFQKESIAGYQTSSLQADFYNLGAKYVFYKKRAYAALSLDARIPHNFETYTPDTSNKEFEYGSSYEYLMGMIIGARFGESFFETAFKYNMRAGDFSDQMIIKVEGGFSKEPGTHLRFKTLFVMNTSPMKEAVPFHPRKPTLSEDVLLLGLDLRLALSGSLYTEVGYNKVLWGKNTWNVGEFVLSFGFLLK
jgi:hypothetical protein